jgi:hypothetical protein
MMNGFHSLRLRTPAQEQRLAGPWRLEGPSVAPSARAVSHPSRERNPDRCQSQRRLEAH